MSKQLSPRSASMGASNPSPRTSHLSPSGHSVAASSSHSKLQTRQVSWPGSKSRITLTVWNDDTHGPGCDITFHDATISHIDSKYGKYFEIDPVPYGGGYTGTKHALSFEKALTPDGRLIVPPSLIAQESNPFKDNSLVLFAKASAYSQVLLNDGEDGEYRPAPYGYGSSSSRRPESKLDYQTRNILKQLWSNSDITETKWWKLPLRCAKLDDLTTGKFVSSKDKGSVACPVQFIFSGEPLKEKDIESGKDLHLPPIASAHDPPYEEDEYSVRSNRFILGEYVTRADLPGIEGITQRESYNVRCQQDRGSKWDTTSHSTSPVDKRPDITVSKGLKGGEPWMQVRYNEAAVRKTNRCSTLRISTDSNAKPRETKLVPWPVRDVAGLELDTLTTPDGEAMKLERLFEAPISAAVTHTLFMRPPPDAPAQSLTWSEHGDHPITTALARVIKHFGSEWSELPIEKVEIRGCRNGKEYYPCSEDAEEIPVSLTFTLCRPTPEVEEELDRRPGGMPEEVIEEESPPTYQESQAPATQAVTSNDANTPRPAEPSRGVIAPPQGSRKSKRSSHSWFCF